MNNIVDTSYLIHEKDTPSNTLSYFYSSLLLPEGHVLAIHQELHIITLFNKFAEKSPIVEQVRLSANATQVFLCVLEAYPYYCPHQVLLDSIYPGQCPIASSSKAEKADMWEYALRPIYRAVEKITEELGVLGIEVYSARGLGYQLGISKKKSLKI